MTSRLPLVLMSALLIAVSLGHPVPDNSEIDDWADSFKNAFNKAKDTVKSGLDSASDKISQIGENIKNSDTYGKVSGELHSVGEKISKAGENIKESDTFQSVKNSFNKGVETIKTKFDD